MPRYVTAGYWTAGYAIETDEPRSMRLAWQNEADAATIIDVGSQVATLPATNLQRPHLSRKWHTLAGVKSSYVVFDRGSEVACSLLALLGSNLTSSATIRLRASSTDPGAIENLKLDTTTVSAGVKSGYGAAYKWFDAKTARYWRLDIADTTLADNLQVGRLFLGPSWKPSVPQLYDWSVTPLDQSDVGESYGGQSFPDERPQKRVLEFFLDWMNEAEMYGNAFAMARAAGVVKEVLAVPDPDGAYVSEQAVYGLCAASQPLVRRGYRVFRQKFAIKERL